MPCQLNGWHAWRGDFVTVLLALGDRVAVIGACGVAIVTPVMTMLTYKKKASASIWHSYNQSINFPALQGLIRLQNGF